MPLSAPVLLACTHCVPPPAIALVLSVVKLPAAGVLPPIAALSMVPPLIAGVVKLGELMRDPAAGVMSLDLNPVLLDSKGKGCVVVDAVVFQG